MSKPAINGAHPAKAGRSVHPGAGRRKAPLFPKGRVLRETELDAVRRLIGAGPYERALLIEYLHKIQDAERCLPAGHMHALAELMRIPMAEVYEVATFYAHFDVVMDGEAKPPRITIRVCDSLSCMLAGSDALLLALQSADMADVRVVRAPCIGACATAPAIEIGHHHLGHATAETAKAIVAAGHTHAVLPAYTDMAVYEKSGGYKMLRACTSGTQTPDTVIATLSEGGLRGLGGAGFPTGRKWGLVRAEKGPRVMAVNGDEGEPGTFKDRTFLEANPHAFIEGMLIAAWAIDATDVYIYMRDEYPAVLEILAREIAKVQAPAPRRT